MIGPVRALPGVSTPHATAFEAMFEATSPRVYAYARRHADAEVAQDIVGDVYLVAWRRRRDLPAEPLPWLLVTARHTLHRHWRNRSVADRLAAELQGIEALATASEVAVADRLDLVAAFAALSEDDRETLLLVGWDGLTPQQAADVVGCSANTFAARLSRARRRLTRLTEPTHTPLRTVAATEGE